MIHVWRVMDIRGNGLENGESRMGEHGKQDGGTTWGDVIVDRHHRTPASRHNAYLRARRRGHDADTV